MLLDSPNDAVRKLAYCSPSRFYTFDVNLAAEIDACLCPVSSKRYWPLYHAQ